ncbi:PEP-CTERM sorting domain-containing protein [Rugamonas sp.]|uniref:PEP-CTERM sorting domain-containing protein n=1 Tax=Rugamonas sp. TaxID=1926287 RepID=UPI0025F846AC|nr:PEP-CTERM sorting domain-containing protein [Rugamonas sp.]
MTIDSSLKFAVAAAALAISGAASATVALSTQYALTASDTLVDAGLKEYTFNYTVTNLDQSNGANTGLDGFTIYVPDSAIYVGSTHPDAATPHSAGHWTEGSGSALDISNGSGNYSQNLYAPAGYHVYTWWGQDPTSVYGTTAGNNSASFSITLKNVASGDGQAGISSYFGGNTPVNGQEYASIVYGNYTTFTTGVTGASPITAAVPEPETYAMLAAGLGLLGFMARRRKQRAA